MNLNTITQTLRSAENKMGSFLFHQMLDHIGVSLEREAMTRNEAREMIVSRGFDDVLTVEIILKMAITLRDLWHSEIESWGDDA